jgi:hypothetical protein
MAWLQPGARLGIGAAVLVVIFYIPVARAQVNPSGNEGGLTISAGALGSGYSLQYGNRKMLAVTTVVDADTRRKLGIEGEGRWIEFHQTAKVHAETYSGGVRYHFDMGRFQPYVKGLVGLGDFNFPYNLATGHYFIVTGGGGLDYRLNARIHIRAVDVEYQDWPQFTYGNMTSVGVSAGVRVRVF